MTAGLPKIALCLEYPLLLRGGVSVLVEELITGLAGTFEVWLVSPDASLDLKGHPAFCELGGHIHYQTPCLPPKKRYNDAAGGLAQRLRSENIQLAHFHAGGTFGWGNRWPGASVPHHFRNAGIATVWTNHLTEQPAAGFRIGGALHRLGRFLAPLAVRGKTSQMLAVDQEIAVSKHDLAFFTQHFPQAAHKLTCLYHSRLDTCLPEPSTPRQKSILSMGHIAYRKGQDTLVRAFLQIAPEFPEWKLELAGHDSGGGCWQEIEHLQRTHPHGNRVHLLGSCNDAMERMSSASLFVQPSREEALGLALQEAIFLGCPAVGTRVGGIPEVIDEGITGLLVPPEDPESLASAMAELMNDDQRRNRMGSAGRSSIRSKGMTRQHMLDTHRALYLQCLSKR